MKDLLNSGASWLAGKQKAFAAREVTYSRASQTLTLAATIGRSEFEITDSNGIQTSLQSRDYIISAEDFTLSTSANEPQAGDRITDGTMTCEVMSPGGEQPWRWCDGHHKQMRIHTKVIS